MYSQEIVVPLLSKLLLQQRGRISVSPSLVCPIICQLLYFYKSYFLSFVFLSLFLLFNPFFFNKTFVMRGQQSERSTLFLNYICIELSYVCLLTNKRIP